MIVDNAVPTTESAQAAPESMADRAYRVLKEQILSGERPGQSFLSEGQAAQELEISRTPVREAFLRLQAEGWLQLYPKRGALVLPIQPGERAAVIEARELLENHAVERLCAAQDVPESLLVDLRGVVDQQRQALSGKEGPSYARADVLFHQTVVRAGGNPILSANYVALADRQRRMTNSSVWGSAAIATDVVDQHAELADLLEAKDAAGYRELLHRHLENNLHP